MRWKAMSGVVVLLALAGTACSGGGGDGGVATLGGGSEGAAAASASPSVDPQDAFDEFAECMREHGFEDFQDPVVNDDGTFTFGGPGPDGGDPPSEQDIADLQAATEACQHLLPEGFAAPQLSPEEEAALQDAMVAYARCMREHGVDIPDPDFSDGGTFQIGGPGVDPSDPDFQDADAACRNLLQDAFPGGGPDGAIGGPDANG